MKTLKQFFVILIAIFLFATPSFAEMTGIAEAIRHFNSVSTLIRLNKSYPEYSQVVTPTNPEVLLETKIRFDFNQDTGRTKGFIIQADGTERQLINCWQGIISHEGKTSWYKFNNAGIMETGWVSDNGHLFYLREELNADRGKMYTGTLIIEGLTLVFTDQGALQSMEFNSY